jgi:hypothetical protein
VGFRKDGLSSAPLLGTVAAEGKDWKNLSRKAPALLRLLNPPYAQKNPQSGPKCPEDSKNWVARLEFGISKSIDRSLSWLAFGLLLETMIFYLHVYLQIAPYYPRVYDQLTYMLATTRILDDFSERGFVALVRPFFSPMSTGIIFPLQGALVQLALGTSRAALLSTNLIYFIIAQLCVFLTARRSLGTTQAAWLPLALFIGCIGVFKTAGGIADYRIDFAAMCLFGIWVCSLSWTNEFTSRKFSVLAGAVAALLILTRFITAAYIGPILIILFLYVAFAKRRDDSCYFVRIANILTSGIIVAVIALPALFLASGPINSYYVRGHLSGEEPAVRAAEVGVIDSISNIFYYPRALLDYQVGTAGVAIIAAALMVASIGKLRSRHLRLRNSFDSLVFTVALATPLVVLSFDFSKSPVVIGIVLIPLMLLIASIWQSFAAPLLGHRSLKWTTRLVVLAGAITFVINGTSHRNDLSPEDQTEIERLNFTIATYSAEFEKPKIAFDRLVDYLNGATLRYYFRQEYGPNRAAPAFTESLAGIFAVRPEDALAALKSSDVVVLTNKTNRGTGPFDSTIIECWDALDQFAENNLKLRASGNIGGIPYRIFVRDISPIQNP